MTNPADQREGGRLDDLVVSIVAWRSAALTVDCLASIAAVLAHTGKPRVIVVDNDSGDGTAEAIETAIQAGGWGSWATVLRAPGNHGFAAGNNIAIRHAFTAVPHFRHVLLLNPDTVVRPHVFEVLLDFMATHREVGIAGGRSEDPDTTPQHCCFRFPGVLSEFSGYLRLGLVDRLLKPWITRVGIPEQPVRVDWVSGAHMMIRREVIDAIGLMDEGYFLYFEETDFTLRARRAGWSCWHVPASRVVHLVGQSSGVTRRDAERRRMPAYWFESRRRYFILNYGRAYAALVDAAALLGLALWSVRRLITRKANTDPLNFIGDLLSHSALWRGRKSLRPRITAR